MVQPPGSQEYSVLVALFRPPVEAVVRPLVQAQAAVPPQPATDDEVKEVLDIITQVGQAQGVDPDELAEKLLEVERELRQPHPLTPEEIEEVIQDSVLHETVGLIDSWLTILVVVAGDNADVVEADNLDDAMLPPLPPELAEAFEQSFVGYLDLAKAKDALRQVKKALPAGQALPADAAILLSIEGILVL